MTHAHDKKSILIVEDDPFIAMDLADTFESRGYEVKGPVADVDAGLKEIKAACPDVALLDYNLGRETSIEIAQKLEVKGVPYVFLSGQIEKVIIGNSKNPPQVIAKPFVPERLVKVIERMVA